MFGLIFVAISIVYRVASRIKYWYFHRVPGKLKNSSRDEPEIEMGIKHPCHCIHHRDKMRHLGCIVLTGGRYMYRTVNVSNGTRQGPAFAMQQSQAYHRASHMAGSDIL